MLFSYNDAMSVGKGKTGSEGEGCQDERGKHDLITFGVFVYRLKMTWLKLNQLQRVRNGK